MTFQHIRLVPEHLEQLGPKQYRANPLEFLLTRLAIVPPAFQTREIDQVFLKIILFLEDKDLPDKYSRTFFDGLRNMILSTERRERLNGWFALRMLQDVHKRAIELRTQIEQDATWARVEKEFEDYFNSFGPPDSDIRRRHVERLQCKGTPAFFLPPTLRPVPQIGIAGRREKEKEEKSHLLAEEARCYESKGRHQEALSCYERALALRPLDRAIRFAKSNCHLLLNQPDRTLEILQDLCKEEPENAMFQSAHGIALMKLERFDEALMAMEKALELDPGRTSTLINKSNVLFRMGRVQESALLLDATIEKNPDNPAIEIYRTELSQRLSQAAHDAFKKEDMKLAKRFANRAVVLDPSNSLAWSINGLLMTEEGLLEEALDCYERALQIEPSFLPALRGRAKLTFLLGQLDEAISCFDEVLSHDPNDAHLWNDFGTCCAQASLWDKARSCFERALTLDPSHPLHWSNMGGILVQIARNEEEIKRGLKQFERALELDPTHLQSMFGRAAALYYLERYQDASSQLEALIELAPAYPQAADLLRVCQRSQEEK